ncbi:MAG: toll/interleukin-1 receptor domain-containing protein [Betaproteobacteria bacterium]
MAPRRVFLSYSRDDKVVLQELVSQMEATRFEDCQLEAWYDLDRRYGVEAGEDWSERLKAEIAACDVFCIFLTANWAKSDNCLSELNWAESAHKRVIQVQVRETAIPRPKASRVPNGAAWIGADMTEASRGRRDELWRGVVKEVQRTVSSADPVIDLCAARAADTPSAPQVKDFDTLCEVIECLHAYKRFHDVVHDLYDRNYKAIQSEVALGTVATRTRAECRTAIELAKADIHTAFTDKSELLKEDSERIEVLLRGLDEFRTALGAAPTLQDPDKLDAFLLSLLDFGSLLSRSLSYFNRRMIMTAKSFNPKRFMESLQNVLDGIEALRKDELVRWAELTDPESGLLFEHVALQVNQDSLMNCEPDELDGARKRKEFLENWPKITRQMDPLLKLWNDTPPDARLDEDTQEKRRLLLPRFTAVRDSVAASAEPIDPDKLKALKRCYGDFWDTFDKYFLGVDKALKGEYERVEMEMERRA